VGDEVFGGGKGVFAEYVLKKEDSTSFVPKPDNISHDQAAAVPIAGLTALQALRDSGKLKAGEKVLINGASGGVGTLAVQIAKSFGAEVTGVCSTRNLEMVRSIGADHVIDYKKDNYTQKGLQYDLIIDMVGNHSISDNRKVLKPEGRMVMVGGAKGNWIAPFLGSINAKLRAPFVDQEIITILSEFNSDDLNTLGELMRTGEMDPVIGSHFELAETAEAIRHSEQGHARGKIIIEIN
jgi:NADPH:quinone reductase-like Zn-dependent oxidoreductase